MFLPLWFSGKYVEGLTWAIGTSCGHAILLSAAVRFNTTAALHTTSEGFFVFTLFALLLVPNTPDVEQSGQPRGKRSPSLRTVPLALLCLILLSTGFESGLSSWLSTYMTRGGYLLSVTISATTAFGLGVVISHLFHSRRIDAARSAHTILRLHPAVMVFATLSLIFSDSPLLSVPCAFFAGAGIGPM